ncbi:endonuclease/exonuclease/phosphatase family protein [Novipirellula aureliae]|nr:endonuclease/exonuclease/phosphatase family protein [Novipirellula aureliae]
MHTEVRGDFGIGVFSRFPMEEVDRFTLNTDIQSIAATIQVPNGRSLRLYATHPLPPIGEVQQRLRNEQLTQLATRIKAFGSKQVDSPIVLLGDFNLTPWSPHFNELQTATKLQRVGSRFDLTPTWYRYPLFPFGLVIDHVMISNDIVCTEHRIGRLTGSDHRRVSVVLDTLTYQEKKARRQ